MAPRARARSESASACRRSCSRLFAFAPPLLGMAARATHPGLTNPNIVLPTVLVEQLPPWFGALALAAVFSAEVSTCDAILFMLATSLSQDLYKRFLQPDADDRELLLIARLASLARRHRRRRPRAAARDRPERAGDLLFAARRQSARAGRRWSLRARRGLERGARLDRRRQSHAPRGALRTAAPFAWIDPTVWRPRRVGAFAILLVVYRHQSRAQSVRLRVRGSR